VPTRGQASCVLYTSKEGKRAQGNTNVADCTLQTYFIGKGRVDYFMIVKSSELEGTFPQTQSTALPTDAEKTCFAKLKRNSQKAPDDVNAQAGII
jgi:hypothetical protein